MGDRADEASRAELQRQESLTAWTAQQRRDVMRVLADAPARCQCGMEIPLDRRKAMPGTTRCADCQEIHEKVQATRRREGR